MRKTLSALPLLCGVVLFLAPGLARAEGFLDFAIGGSFTQDHNASFETGGARATVDASFDDSFATGVRGGYWFEAVPWLGVGGMVSYFEPDIKPAGVSGYDSQDLGVVPITALLMLRAPLLPSDAVPRGQFQPYLNVGPGAFVSAIDSNHHDDDETSVEVGVDVHAGATWMFTSRFGMFAEYRFTHFSPDIEQHTHHHNADFNVDSTLDTHHVMAGFAWHFD